MKQIITFCQGDKNLKTILNSHGLGEIIFIKDKEEISGKLSKNQKFLYLDLPQGLNFDLAYFIRFAPINSMGLFYKKNDGNSFFILDKDKRIIIKQDSFYFDGLTSCGVIFSDFDNFNEIVRGNYSNTVGIPLGKNKNYQDSNNLSGALFLDRDGIINHDIGYLHEKEKVIIYEEIIDIIKTANKMKMPVVVLTNQSGVGKGKFREEDVISLHRFLQEEIQIRGGKIDAWFFSPFHPTEGQGLYKKETLLRKPGPGMALLACELFPLDFSKSFMVGDKITDALLIPGLNCIHLKRDYDLDEATFPVCTNYKEIKEIIFGIK